MSVTGVLDAPCIGILDASLSGQELLDCPLHLPLINRTLAVVKGLIAPLKLIPYDISSRRGELKYLILHASRDQTQIMLRFVLRSTEAVARIRKAYSQLKAEIPELCSVSANIQPIPHAIVEGEEELLLGGDGILWEQYNSLSLAFAPQSFSQVTPETAEALYAYVTGLVREVAPRSLLDLFCGVGGFSLHGAQSVPTVTGVELSAQAIHCATLGAERNGLPHATFVSSPVDQFLAGSVSPIDVVICNPPRRGLSAATIEQIAKLAPQRFIYSSCNPESLFRDLAMLKGYRVISLAPFEMFPLTEHLEVVACLDLL